MMTIDETVMERLRRVSSPSDLRPPMQAPSWMALDGRGHVVATDGWSMVVIEAAEAGPGLQPWPQQWLASMRRWLGRPCEGGRRTTLAALRAWAGTPAGPWRREQCDDCYGSGAGPGLDRDDAECNECHGAGEVWTREGDLDAGGEVLGQVYLTGLLATALAAVEGDTVTVLGGAFAAGPDLAQPHEPLQVVGAGWRVLLMPSRLERKLVSRAPFAAWTGTAQAVA